MDKTGQMIEFEEETGQTLEEADERGITLNFYLKYIQWLETELLENSVKANAYDRLMSGGKKTLKEWANILERPFAVDEDGDGCFSMEGFYCKLELDETSGCWVVYNKLAIPRELVDYKGDWKDSLTLPDRLEKK